MTLTDLLPAEPDPDAVFTTFAGWAKQTAWSCTRTRKRR